MLGSRTTSTQANSPQAGWLYIMSGIYTQLFSILLRVEIKGKLFPDLPQVKKYTFFLILTKKSRRNGHKILTDQKFGKLIWINLFSIFSKIWWSDWSRSIIVNNREKQTKMTDHKNRNNKCAYRIHDMNRKISSWGISPKHGGADRVDWVVVIRDVFPNLVYVVAALQGLNVNLNVCFTIPNVCIISHIPLLMYHKWLSAMCIFFLISCIFSVKIDFKRD